MEISNRDLHLFEAFLLREADDYPKYREDSLEREKWLRTVQSKIKEKLAGYKGKANYIRITSLTNMGLVDRELKLTAHPWDLIGDVHIILCNCGSVYCWGNVVFPEGGRKKDHD